MWFRFNFPEQNGFFYHSPYVHSFVLCVLILVFWHKMAIFYHNPFVHSFFLCGLDLVFQHKMAIFDHYCAPQLLFGIQVYWFSSTKRAIFYNNPFVHRFIWPSSCITLFHKVGLICFIAFFGLSLAEVWFLDPGNSSFSAKKYSGTNWPLWPTYTCQRKVLRLGCLLIFVSYNF